MEETDQRRNESFPHEYGLFEVIDERDIRECDSLIIAVHGLAGHAFKTWQDKKSGNIWLRDFLPQVLPRAKIMTYAYNSSFAFSDCVSNISQFAHSLLNFVRQKTLLMPDGSPIIFICHSLGGIVVKKALCLAHENPDGYKFINKNCTGIMFFGTPHQGASLAIWATYLARVANTLSVVPILRTNLLENLTPNSQILRAVAMSFAKRAENLEIYSFIEQEKQIFSPVVLEESAFLGFEQHVEYIQANHRTMCRFSSSQNQNYQIVQNAVLNLVENGKKKLLPLTDSQNLISKPIFSPEEANETIQEKDGADDGKNDLQPEILDDASKINLLQINQTQQTPFESVATVSLRVHNCRRKLVSSTEKRILDPFVIQVPANMPTEFLTHFIEEHTEGWIQTSQWSIRFEDRAISHTWRDVSTQVISVTDGPSVYNLEQGLRINSEQTFANFLSALFPRAWHTEVGKDPNPFASEREPHLPVGYLSVGQQSQDADFLISFERAKAVPTDGQVHGFEPLWPGLPVLEADARTLKGEACLGLTNSCVVPLISGEAMWVSFHISDNFQARVIPSLDDTAILSPARTTTKNVSTTIEPRQDYLVLPDQPYLHGILDKEGALHQFAIGAVEPPHKSKNIRDKLNNLFRTSALRHHQKSSPEISSSSGNQRLEDKMYQKMTLEFIPSFHLNNISLSRERDTICTNRTITTRFDRQQAQDLEGYPSEKNKKLLQHIRNISLEPLKSPKELGLKAGDRAHFKNINKLANDRIKYFRDLAEEAGRESHEVVDVQLRYPSYGVVYWSVSFDGSTQPAIVLETHTDDDFSDLLGIVQCTAPQVGTFRGSHSLYVKNAIDSEWLRVPGQAFAKRYTMEEHLNISESNKFPLIEQQTISAAWMRRPAGNKSIEDKVLCRFVSDIYLPYQYRGGGSFFLEINADMTIADVVGRIEKVLGQPELQLISNECGHLIHPEEKFTDVFRSTQILAAEGEDCRQAIVGVKSNRLLAVTLWGLKLSVPFSGYDTIKDFGRKIEKVEGLPFDQLRFIFAGQQLDYGRTISDYNIPKDSTIHIVLRIRGAGMDDPWFIRANLSFAGISKMFNVDSISVLRDEIEKLTGVDKKLLAITLEGQLDPVVGEHEFSSDTSVDVSIMKNQSALAQLQSGGRIDWKLQADREDPRIWDFRSKFSVTVFFVDITSVQDVLGANLERTRIGGMPIEISSDETLAKSNFEGSNKDLVVRTREFTEAKKTSRRTDKATRWKQRTHPPPLPARSANATWVTAMYDFAGQEPGDLSFKQGDKIEVLQATSSRDDWWHGCLDGRFGHFPANYCFSASGNKTTFSLR